MFFRQYIKPYHKLLKLYILSIWTTFTLGSSSNLIYCKWVCFAPTFEIHILSFVFISFFFGKLTDILKEEYTKIIRGIPQIYNVHENIKQQMDTGSHKADTST
jgi:hypothetical protein